MVSSSRSGTSGDVKMTTESKEQTQKFIIFLSLFFLQNTVESPEINNSNDNNSNKFNKDLDQT